MAQEKKLKAVTRMVGILGKIEKGDCSRTELTEEFGVSERTISRDINTLSIEFPVYYDSVTGSYRFVDGYSLLGKREMIG